MPQSLAQIYLHIVFSTKNRRPDIQDRAIRDELHAYLAALAITSARQFCVWAGWPITFTSFADTVERLPWLIS